MARATVSRERFVLRARILSIIFIIVAFLLVIRLYFVQVVHGGQYRAEAMAQYTAADPDTSPRGNIFFTGKDGALVSAAVQRTGWRIAINPKLITDPSALYRMLNAIVPVDQAAFMTSAAKKSDPYEEVAQHLDDDAAAKVRALKQPGVLLVADQWRFYPGGDLAAQTLGFVGYTKGGSAKSGTYGLEKEYDNTLAESNEGLYINPFAEIFTNLRSALSTDPAAHEGSVITSIEPQVQHQLENTLEGVMKQYTPKMAGGIVMDPRTGAIVAIGARPAFDPNDYGNVSDLSVYDNPLVSGRYELGSIMKPLTMAAAIDSGAVTPETTYDDTGCVMRSTYRICNFDHKARGVIPMQQILSQSLNVGVTFLADKMGHETFTHYFRLDGLGDRTGVDLPSEVQGDLSPLGSGHGPDANYATAAFGQGIAVSPIEMTRALSALANDGVLPNPHLALAIKYDSGVTRAIPTTSGPRVMKSSTAETVTNMLIHVFDIDLMHGALKKPHYSIAAKTGTAQIPKPGGGYYPDGTFLHSFFGYFPAHDPKFIVFLFAIEPHGVEYASASLANPFNDIATYLINYYDIPPDR